MALTDRNPTAIERFFLHLHPNSVDKSAIVFTKTFGLGGINALLFILLVISGMLLRFTYIPTPEEAYNSIIYLQNNVLFGRLLRNIHHWSAMLMVIASFLHLLRVYYSQSFYGERSKNWIYGLLLLVLVLFSNFTGYLLPWDQLAYWAVTIMTSMLEYIPLVGTPLASFFRGGATVDSITLLNFYTWHTGVLPLLFVFFMSMHFWLIRKAKGVQLAKNEKSNMVKTYPNLVVKEVLVALILIVGIFTLSIFFNAPLQDKASISISPNPSKAPWYFMGVQELLLHMHPVFAVFILPVLLIALFFYLPYFKLTNVNTGFWFNSIKGKNIVLISTLFSFVFTLLLIIISDSYIDFTAWFSSMPTLISNGLLPLLLYIIPVLSFIYFNYKVKKYSKPEILMALVTILLVSYIVMMMIGQWFRGENMHLVF